jgi:hypothetical protein
LIGFLTDQDLVRRLLLDCLIADRSRKVLIGQKVVMLGNMVLRLMLLITAYLIMMFVLF